MSGLCGTFHQLNPPPASQTGLLQPDIGIGTSHVIGLFHTLFTFVTNAHAEGMEFCLLENMVSS